LIGDAASSTTYSLRSITDGKAVRGDATAGLSQPKQLTISHSEVSRSTGVADRHLIRLDRVETRVIDSIDVAASVYLVVESPRDNTVTAAQIKDMITQLKNFLITATYVDKMLNGEP
jgi:hypothetical protein